MVDTQEIKYLHPLINTDGLLGGVYVGSDGSIDPTGNQKPLLRQASHLLISNSIALLLNYLNVIFVSGVMLLSKDRQNLLKIISYDFIFVGIQVKDDRGNYDEGIWEFESKNLYTIFWYINFEDVAKHPLLSR